MKSLDMVIFNGKKFSNILEEIYNNQKKKSSQVQGLILELKDLIKNIGDATLVVPLIKEYLDIGVKNDDQLVKLAIIIQKISQEVSENPEYQMSDLERKALEEEIDKMKKLDNKK